MTAEDTNQQPQQSEPDAIADPANNDIEGHDWATEGGATPTGPATSVDAESDATEDDA